MYSWLVYLHLVGAFGFFFSHGASVAVTFKLRKETDPQKVIALIELSRSTVIPLYVSFLVLLVGGVWAGFAGAWWRMGWIWAALFLLIATSVAMFAMSKPYYGRLDNSARVTAAGRRPVPGQDLETLRMSRVPLVLAVMGYASMAVIIWLMMFKPF